MIIIFNKHMVKRVAGTPPRAAPFSNRREVERKKRDREGGKVRASWSFWLREKEQGLGVQQTKSVPCRQQGYAAIFFGLAKRAGKGGYVAWTMAWLCLCCCR
jgi:hypothetical protein